MSLFSRKSPPKAPPAAPEPLRQELAAHPRSAAEAESSVERQPAPSTDNARVQAPAPAPAETSPAAPAPRVSWLERRVGQVDWGRVRIAGIFSFFLLCFGFLWCRAWYLQMIDGPRLAEYARRQHITTEIVSGKRGMILDREGQVLARSVEALSVYANPSEVTDCLTTANTLGPILGIDPQKLYDQLSRTRRHFLWLRRKVDDRTAAAVRTARLPGIGLSREYERVYPFKHMAGQLLGFVGFDDKGLEGLERSLDGRLGSAPMRQTVQRDATGRRFYLRREGEEDPRGEDIRLTLDVQMQFFAEEAVARAVQEEKARWGGALVVHVPTGEILAWAQYPFFNPNNFRASRPQIYRNRLAQDALEPGSTFKPLVLASAMQERKVNRNTVIDCENGRWTTKYVTIRDTSSRDQIPVHKVLRYSSNIGMAKIGLMLGSHTFHGYLRSLGFGERTGVPVAENRGILRRPRDWSEVDCMSISFGQGVSVTPVQLAQAYLTMLNGGVRKNLVLVRDMAQPEERVQIFSRGVASEVRGMMREVVEEKDGTGRRAAVPGVEVAGKTGTAQKADSRTGSYGTKRLASFVGFLPADNPLYLILVFIDEPQLAQYGGIIAAPVFREIAQRSLAYAGVLDSSGRLRREAQTVEAASRQPQGRGYSVAGLDSPFTKPTEKSRRLLAEKQAAQILREPENDADALRLPGYLAKASATVPDVQGKTLRNAVELFARAGIVPELKGEGMRVVRQSPQPGSPWPKGEESKGGCVLWLSEK